MYGYSIISVKAESDKNILSDSIPQLDEIDIQTKCIPFLKQVT